MDVAQDAEGPDVEDLREVLDQLRPEGQRPPKFIYNVPDFHNPTGITMSRRRREAVLELVAANGMFFVEDSPYREHRDRMVAAMRECFPDLSMTVPLGSYYLWVPLPAGVSGDDLASAGAREGVFLHAGSEFCANPNHSYPANYWPPASHVRLAYSFASPDRIDEGIRRLARAYASITS